MTDFPIQYATLSADALNAYLEKTYALEGLHTQLLIRNVSDTYVVAQGQPADILKIYHDHHRKVAALKGEVELLLTLSQGKAKVALPIADTNGNYVQSFPTSAGLRHGILFAFAPGKSYKDLSPDQIRIVGREMAHNHNLLQDLKLQHSRHAYTLESTLDQPLIDFQPAFERFGHPGFAYLKEIAQKTKARLQSMELDNFSHGYCHYDYLPKNFHFSDQNEFTLFDFDFAGEGFLVNDLMTFQAHYFYHRLYAGYTQEKAEQCLDTFLEAYQAHRSISDEELAAIPYLGMCFFLYYLAIQYKGYDDFSNPYFNHDFLTRWVGWVEKWEEWYCDF